jgi:hypothetical protein
MQSFIIYVQQGNNFQALSLLDNPTHKHVAVVTEHKTIDAAVSAAVEGDLILISPGVWLERGKKNGGSSTPPQPPKDSIPPGDGSGNGKGGSGGSGGS